MEIPPCSKLNFYHAVYILTFRGDIPRAVAPRVDSGELKPKTALRSRVHAVGYQLTDWWNRVGGTGSGNQRASGKIVRRRLRMPNPWVSSEGVGSSIVTHYAATLTVSG